MQKTQEERHVGAPPSLCYGVWPSGGGQLLGLVGGAQLAVGPDTGGTYQRHQDRQTQVPAPLKDWADDVASACRRCLVVS